MAAMVLRPDDYVTATYRGHGWALSVGIPGGDLRRGPRPLEPQRRAGASPYLSSASANFIGENSIVGAGVPIACGGAERGCRGAAGERRVDRRRCHQSGRVHEALNMAAMLALPMILVIENNRYSEMTPIDGSCAPASSPSAARRTESHR